MAFFIYFENGEYYELFKDQIGRYQCPAEGCNVKRVNSGWAALSKHCKNTHQLLVFRGKEAERPEPPEQHTPDAEGIYWFDPLNPSLICPVCFKKTARHTRFVYLPSIWIWHILLLGKCVVLQCQIKSAIRRNG